LVSCAWYLTIASLRVLYLPIGLYWWRRRELLLLGGRWNIPRFITFEMPMFFHCSDNATRGGSAAYSHSGSFACGKWYSWPGSLAHFDVGVFILLLMGSVRD